MKSICLIILTMLCAAKVQAQLITLRGDVAQIDGQPYVKVKQVGCKTLNAPCAYEVRTLSGQKVCRAKVMTTQPQGGSHASKTYYILYEFTEPQPATCEVPFPNAVTLHASDVVTTLYQANIIGDDDIDEEAINDFTDTYGHTFSNEDKATFNDQDLDTPELPKHKKSQKRKETDDQED